MAERAGRLGLPLVQRQDAGAHHLREEGALVDDQRAQQGREAGDLAPDPRIGTRKQTHRITISSGTPRTTQTRMAAGRRSARQGDSRASASSTDSVKAGTPRG